MNQSTTAMNEMIKIPAITLTALCFNFRPHCGQFMALVETSFPQSAHDISFGGASTRNNAGSFWGC
jgi:hypothetical protein